MSLHKPLESITEEDLQFLVENRVCDLQRMSYSGSLGADAAAGRELLRVEVSSYANASGGDFLLGIDQENGSPLDLTGMEIDNLDRCCHTIHELLNTGIRPQIPGVTLRAVPLKNGRWAIVVRVPKSYAAPHQVQIGRNDLQFWSRSSAGLYRMDVDQLRFAFMATDSLAERIRDLRAERLAKQLRGETPVTTSEGPRIVLHIVPLASFAPGARYDLTRVYRGSLAPMAPIYGGILRTRHNFDGFLSYGGPGVGGSASAYVQLFQNGVMEAVETYLLSDVSHKMFPINTLEKCFLDALPGYFALQQRLGIAPPLVVMLSLLGVAGFVIPTQKFREPGFPIDRDALLIPEVMVEEYDTDVNSICRPLFDSLWNAGGFQGSPNFDATGKWVG